MISNATLDQCRFRTFTKGRFQLWVDRVPVVCGFATLCALWEDEGDGRWQRRLGGVSLSDVRAYAKAAA